MEFLNEEQLAAITDRKFVDVEIPEWNTKVTIGSMSAQASIEYASAARKGDQLGAVRILLAASLVNREKKPFGAKTIDSLLAKGAGGVSKIAEAVMQLNTLSKEGATERGEV